jgi:hypothetical protein
LDNSNRFASLRSSTNAPRQEIFCPLFICRKNRFIVRTRLWATSAELGSCTLVQFFLPFETGQDRSQNPRDTIECKAKAEAPEYASATSVFKRLFVSAARLL